ncbi:MAG: DUF1861 family protein [Bacillota bacterium]|nr:DUF1861 family protein [Bacillota bacterium]
MNELANQKAVAAKTLLADFYQTRKPERTGVVQVFAGVQHYDVYNPSIPFFIDGMVVMAARVEYRHDEVSRTMFFHQQGDQWILIPGAPVLDLQDPFVTFINNELWLGGVSVLWDGPRCIAYTTHFYHGKTLWSLEFAFAGPNMMKDIRLLQMSDGKIAVFTRPQGEGMLEKHGCIARIGFTIASTIDQVDAILINQAPLLEGQFMPDEWGGCNQLYNLKNGLIGVIGHLSRGEHMGGVHIIHYYSMSFAIDPATRLCTPVQIIADRNSFPSGPQKNERTADVIFTSGLVRIDDGQAELYAGLSDCQVGRVVIVDPLLVYEEIIRQVSNKSQE